MTLPAVRRIIGYYSRNTVTFMLTCTGSRSTWNTELELFYSGDHVSLLETTMNHLVGLRCHLREDVHSG